MEKNIKDYLHLYLGVKGKLKVRYHHGWEEQEVDSVLSASFDSGNHSFKCFDVYGNQWGDTIIYPSRMFTPILRPLSDMTEEEYEHILYDLRSYDGGRDKGKLAFPDMFMTIQNADVFSYCLKQGFDLFGLIESGLAIDKTKQLAK